MKYLGNSCNYAQNVVDFHNTSLLTLITDFVKNVNFTDQIAFFSSLGYTHQNIRTVRHFLNYFFGLGKFEIEYFR